MSAGGAGYRGLAGIHRRGLGPLSRRRLVVRLDVVRRGAPQRRTRHRTAAPTSTIPARSSPGVNSTLRQPLWPSSWPASAWRAGDRVAVWHGDSTAIHVLFVAIERCGAVVVGIGARAGTREVAAILRSSRPKMLISDQQRSDAARGRRRPPISRCRRWSWTRWRTLSRLNIDAKPADVGRRVPTRPR